MNIEFVITWVDMNDTEWQKEFAKNSGKIDNAKIEVSVVRR